MSSFFQPRSQADVWFRIGKLQVTSTVAVVLFGAIGTVLGAFMPPLLSMTALTNQALFSGQLWRVVTWPFVDSISLWTVLTWLILFYFGAFIEHDLGRNKMAKLYIGLWAIITAAHMITGILLPNVTVLFGLRMIQLMLILLFIAESPHRRFFFGIPAWVLGAVIIGLQVLSMISIRAFGSLLALLLSLAGAAILARTMGLLTNLSWIPSLAPGAPSRTARPRPAGRPRPTSKTKVRTVDDETRMDELLDKISAGGLHSLTKKERAELEKLRQRRRR